MKRLLVALIATFCILSAKVIAEDEIINFPDPYFKDLLLSITDYGQPLIDLNEDGEIQYSEAEAYSGLLWLSFGLNKLTDLSGIKFFTNISRINLEGSVGVKEIDLSGMNKLVEVSLPNNPNLESLNVSGCNLLKNIYCENNNLSKLNIDGCFSLYHIWCFNNSLTEIKLKGCSTLANLACHNNKLNNIDLIDCINLEIINCSHNQISELNLPNMKILHGITCDSNQLKKIDVSNSNVFKWLIANNNQLETLNLRNGNNKSITSFKAYGNPDLKCITVDDATYSKENWKEIDEWTEFSEDCSTGINENPQITFKVFPNPANNTVLIERYGIEAADLRIVDITGRICLIHPIQYGETQIQIDISKLPVGKYIIDIKNETGSLIVE